MTTRPSPNPGPTPTQAARAFTLLAPEVVSRIMPTLARGGYPDRFGVPEIDDAITIYNGCTVAILGRPGHGKSMLCKALARRALATCATANKGRADGEPTDSVVFVTLEEPPEKLALQIAGAPLAWRDVLRGRANGSMDAFAMRLPLTVGPLCVVAHPGLVEGRLAPPVSTDQILSSIELYQIEHNTRVRMVVIDYLQMLRSPAVGRNAGKSDHVMEASRGAVTLARALSAPVIMAVQATRDTDTQKLPIPGTSAGQWASSIEQDCDIVLGICRPSALGWVREEITQTGSAHVEYGGQSWAVRPPLMIVQVNKARDDDAAGQRYLINVDPVTLAISGVTSGH